MKILQAFGVGGEEQLFWAVVSTIGQTLSPLYVLWLLLLNRRDHVLDGQQHGAFIRITFSLNLRERRKRDAFPQNGVYVCISGQGKRKDQEEKTKLISN